MTKRVKVADLASLPPGTGNISSGQGDPIATFNVGGRFYAIDGSCPHRGGPLGDGVLEGSEVVCPLHGWRFDVTTGECVGRPGTRLQCYSAHIEGDGVWIELPGLSDSPDNSTGDRQFMVRFGTMGYVGRFEASSPLDCSRGSRVAVRTSRGMEAGEVLVLAGANAKTLADQPLAGQLLRLLTPEDELLERGLREGQQRAFEACRRLLAERGLPVELVDAEQLLDGETLIFYFLGEHTPQLADVNAELARQYEARIEFRQFLEKAEIGCGPGCGTDAAAGCGSCGDDGCASCESSGVSQRDTSARKNDEGRRACDHH